MYGAPGRARACREQLAIEEHSMWLMFIASNKCRITVELSCSLKTEILMQRCPAIVNSYIDLVAEIQFEHKFFQVDQFVVLGIHAAVHCYDAVEMGEYTLSSLK
jgi:hypothetical protein